MKHKRNDKIIASGVKEHGLYKFMDKDAEKSHALIVDSQANYGSLWH